MSCLFFFPSRKHVEEILMNPRLQKWNTGPLRSGEEAFMDLQLERDGCLTCAGHALSSQIRSLSAPATRLCSTPASATPSGCWGSRSSSLSTAIRVKTFVNGQRGCLEWKHAATAAITNTSFQPPGNNYNHSRARAVGSSLSVSKRRSFVK